MGGGRRTQIMDPALCDMSTDWLAFIVVVESMTLRLSAVEGAHAKPPREYHCDDAPVITNDAGMYAKLARRLRPSASPRRREPCNNAPSTRLRCEIRSLVR